jgi:hypothetical protein
MMTIQRQYSLPNCTLILEGLPGDAIANPSSSRPVLSTLLSAECQITGLAQPLQGGRDFFTSLIKTVNLYAQEILSGVKTTSLRMGELVQLEPVGANAHRLKVQGQAGSTEEPTTEVLLSTVQLFDLVEAVDQFLADQQTLPDLSLSLTPASKQFVRSQHAGTQQIVPATVGAAGLAVAAIALYLVPPPEEKIQPPPDTKPAATTTAPNATPGAQPTLPTVPAITDPAQVATLNQKLSEQVKTAWKPTTDLDQSLSYRVSVNADGQIVGYQGLDANSVSSGTKTPLVNLVQLPKTGGTMNSSAIAQFKVVFNTNKTLEVSPWQASAGAASSAPTPTSPPP